jgi:hypothetical protein
MKFTPLNLTRKIDAPVKKNIEKNIGKIRAE